MDKSQIIVKHACGNEAERNSGASQAIFDQAGISCFVWDKKKIPLQVVELRQMGRIRTTLYSLSRVNFSLPVDVIIT